MQFKSTGKAVREIEQQHFVVFYRPDGRIAHLHAVHVLKGGRPVSRAEAEDEAEERARAQGVDLSSCQKLYTTELPAEKGALRVDPVRGSVISVAAEPPESIRRAYRTRSR